MKLIFEKGAAGRGLNLLPPLDVPRAEIPENCRRQTCLALPELSETEIARHYSALAKRIYGVNSGFYPLGSCTMKYNPKLNEEMASLPGFTDVHPLQPEKDVQGCLAVLYEAGRLLCEITGMDDMSFQPAAGAHGELTGLMMIKAYHENRGDAARTKIIVPDSAHGTNPASAAMCGFAVVNIPSGADGCVDLSALKNAVGADTAGLMLTNPNTLGIFEKDILAITGIVHDAGGLVYYDGANLNAIAGVARPGDMGFDVIHLNLHKTFSTPHGGGGPGSGPVGVKAILRDFLPGPMAVARGGAYALESPKHSIGRVRSFYGNFLVVVRALTYVLTLGKGGLADMAKTAVLNANYMKKKLEDIFPVAGEGLCMHEFVLSLKELKKETGVSALDAAKALQDMGIHPPTMYFPAIVEEALMVEPTETEPIETLNEAIAAFRAIYELAHTSPEHLTSAPLHSSIQRPDEVAAARKPRVVYEKTEM